jgi:hypothetical protein
MWSKPSHFPRMESRQVKSTLVVGFNEGIPNPTKLKMVDVGIL